jgi:hypothetical protein
MRAAVDLLCALTSLGCAALLLRSYRQTRFSLLLWAGLCFVGFLVGNCALFANEVFFADMDLSVWRKAPVLVGLALLLYGMIMETP